MAKFTKRTAPAGGDDWFKVLVMVWRVAFADASRGNIEAQQSIVDFFGLGHVAQLYRQQLISWHPSEIGG